MITEELKERHIEEIRARMGETEVEIWHVGSIKDKTTDQEVHLYRIANKEMLEEEPHNCYTYMTCTIIYNFWGDAEGRGEWADVFVFNGVDGYNAGDPAEEWLKGTNNG